MTIETVTANIAPEGDELARQTAQAKLLREARDELAKRAKAFADAKNRRALERMGLPKARATAISDGAKFNSEDLASLLGVKLLTLRGWMAPAGTSVQREMPQTAKLLLARILADK